MPVDGVAPAAVSPARVLLHSDRAQIHAHPAGGDPRVHASLLVQDCQPFMIVNALIVGAALEATVVDWALSILALAIDGFFVLLA